MGNGRHYVGWEDLPLNTTGIQQAQWIVDSLSALPVAIVYSSALRRAIDTALPLAQQKGLQLQTKADLNEINYGAYQGKLKSELELKLRKDYRYAPLPDGESLHDVYLRVKRFHDSIVHQMAEHKNMAIVGHYWSIRMLLGILLGQEFDDIFVSGGYKPANASVYQVQYQLHTGGRIDCLDQSYLAPMAAINEIVS
jgi:broad specificity phosphatase PhoE